MAKRSAGSAAVRDNNTCNSSVHCSVPPGQLPRHIAELMVAERAWQSGHGRALYPTERAELHSWLQFPHDSDAYLRDLVFKKCLAEEGAGPPLSPEEAADLRAHRGGARESEELRKLVKKNATSAPRGRAKSRNKR
ncbi:MAG TPA: hypothetical protein V6D22_19510 [Candidatus Obscuribacterales bacterium]